MEGHVTLSERLVRSAGPEAVRIYALLGLGVAPTYAAVAEAMDVSDRSARRYVAELVALGFLRLSDGRKSERGGRGVGQGQFEPNCQICQIELSGFDAKCQICHLDGGRGVGQGENSGSPTCESFTDRSIELLRDPAVKDFTEVNCKDLRKSIVTGIYCREDRDDTLKMEQDALFEPGEVPSPAPSDAEILEATARRVLDALNEASGRRFKPLDTSLSHIRQRIRDGATEAELLMVVEHRAAEWKRDAFMAQYLRPTTIFAPEKFEGYLGAAEAWIAGGRKASRKMTELDRRDAMRDHDAIGGSAQVAAISPSQRLSIARTEFFKEHGRKMTPHEEHEAKIACGMIAGTK